jgi:hypothetical protein
MRTHLAWTLIYLAFRISPASSNLAREFDFVCRALARNDRPEEGMYPGSN